MSRGKMSPEKVAASFWRRVRLDVQDKCWLWLGAKTEKGYGKFYTSSRPNLRAHRYSYELAFGDITEDLCVLHKCDNPPCVNPNHLCLGNNQDNSTDMVLKGRAARGDNHPHVNVSENELKVIRALYACGKKSRDIQKRFGITSASASRFKNGQTRPETQPTILTSPSKEATAEQKLLWINQNKDVLRKALQVKGMLRRNEDPKYWIDKLDGQLCGLDLPATISDVRFVNEAEWIREVCRGRVWRVERPGCKSDGHVSETELLQIEPDYVIHNDGDLQHLATQVLRGLEL